MVGNAYSAPSTLLHETCKPSVHIHLKSFLHENISPHSCDRKTWMYVVETDYPFKLVERIAERYCSSPQRGENSISLQHIFFIGLLSCARRRDHQTRCNLRGARRRGKIQRQKHSSGYTRPARQCLSKEKWSRACRSLVEQRPKYYWARSSRLGARTHPRNPIKKK